MFFGLCNSPATFQAMMDNIFADMIDENFIIVYMDNIFLFAPDEITLAEKTPRRFWHNYRRMIYSWNQPSVNSTRLELSTWEWLLKKARFLWILGNYAEFETGHLQLLLRKLEDFWALENYINNLFDISQTWQSLWSLKKGSEIQMDRRMSKSIW